MTSASENKSQALRWETPFVNKPFPSATPMFLYQQGFQVIVMPDGLGRYPGYTVHFTDAPLVLCYEESNAPVDQNWVDAGGHELKPSASYIWKNSPLSIKNRELGCKATFENGEMKHYIIAGGDNIIHVLSTVEPSITEFTGPQTISSAFKF